MDFEYDAEKSETNRLKHGISFEEAKALWTEPGAEMAARTESEPGFLRVALLNGRLYTGFFTIREGKIRLISVRRSRLQEEKFYEEHLRNEKEKENHGRGT